MQLGEMFPELSQSRMSRVLFINVTKDDVRSKELKYIQTHQEELQYSMKKYLEYVIENIEKIKSDIPRIFDMKVQEASTKVTYRTAEMLSGLYIGYSTLIEFAFTNGVITLEEMEKMLKQGWDILIQLGEEQNSMVETISPINMLLSAVEVLTNTGRLTTFDYTSAKFMKQQDIMKDGFVGFYDEEEKVNLVYPDLLYKAVKNFYNEQGIAFPWNKATMCKELFNQEYLYKTPKQERPQIRRYNPRSKQEETFIGLLQDKIYITCRYNENGMILTK